MKLLERPTNNASRANPANVPGQNEAWEWTIDDNKPAPIVPTSQKPGVYVGAYKDKKTGQTTWLRDETDRHVLLAAPTRAGKGVSFAVPNVLTYQGSMVIHDLKGELWALTARYRKEHLGNLVFRFDATCNDGTGACFNPLDEVRLGTDYEVADAANIATLIVDPDGKGFSGENAHWARTARSFLTGAILHVLYFEDDKTMRGLDAFLSDPRRTSMELFERMLYAKHDPDYKRGWIDANGEPTMTCPTVAMAARDMTERPDGERGSVMSSVKSYLDVYRDEIIAKNTCRSDFSIQDLMKNDRPVTLYIVNNPSDMDRVMPLTRLLFNFVMRGFTRSMRFDDAGRPVKDYKHPLLLLMDEFSALGNLSIFASALSFVAGYGIRVLIIVQDYIQLSEKYGNDTGRSIMANMHIKIIYAPGDPTTAELFSKMLGTMTVRTEDKSIDPKGRISRSVRLESRQMLTPEEFMALGKQQAIVHIMHQPPIACGRITYYEEPLFKQRVLPQLKESSLIPREQQAGFKQNIDLRQLAEEQAKIRLATAAEKKRQRDEAQGVPQSSELFAVLDELSTPASQPSAAPATSTSPPTVATPAAAASPAAPPATATIPADLMAGADEHEEDGLEDLFS